MVKQKRSEWKSRGREGNAKEDKPTLQMAEKEEEEDEDEQFKLNTKDKHGSSSLQLLDDDGSALSLVILCPPWQWSSSCGDLYCMAIMLHCVASSFISLRDSRVGICVLGAVSLHWVTTRLLQHYCDNVFVSSYYFIIGLSSEVRVLYVLPCVKLMFLFWDLYGVIHYAMVSCHF